MAESALNQPATQPPDALWQQIVQAYRQLCVLQRQARRAESNRFLHDELPARILAWAELDGADGAAKARRLDHMFQREQRRLADVWLLEDLMEHRLRTDVLPALSARIDTEVQRAMQRHVPNRTPLQTSVRDPWPASTPEPLSVAASQPARVSVGDIPSIIDLIFEQERQSGARHLAA